MRVAASDDLDQALLIPYRLRCVRVGIQATAIVIAWLVAYQFLPGAERVGASYDDVLLIGILGATGISMLPWRRLFERGHGIRLMYAWSVLDIVLVTWGLLESGGSSSPMFYVYFITTLFFAISYPLWGQVALGSFTMASYVVGLFLSGGIGDPSNLFVRLSALATMQFMATFLSTELMSQIKANTVARRESEARARALAIVAAGARRMSTLDPDTLLDGVVDSALALGFDVSTMALIDYGSQTYTAVHSRNLPAEYREHTHALDRGLTGLVVNRRETVVVDDYRSISGGVDSVRAIGVRGAIATPVWSAGELAAVLLVGTTRRRRIREHDVEAFELLAAHAGRALDNARLFEEQRKTVERLAELDGMKDDFISTVSHELRTPLTVVEGIGLTLERRWGALDDSERLHLVQRLNRNATTLDSIIATLLDFSRLERGGPTVHTEPVMLDSLIESTTSRLRPLFERHDLDVRIARGVVVEVDAALLDRVVENLLANAVKHTPDGTHVAVFAMREGESVTVTVLDDGPGIAESDRARLGERFFRGTPPDRPRAPGTGLGLALVHKILALHGSSLAVESVEGVGSAFSFRLSCSSSTKLAG